MKTSNHLLHKNEEDCSPVQELEGGEVKAASFLGLVLGNHLIQQLIQILLVLQHGLPQNGRLKNVGIKSKSEKPRKSMSHKTASGKTPS